MNPCFIADVHLGKLAKALRLLGFDTFYHTTSTPGTLLRIAAEENRILLSRGLEITKHAATSLRIESEDVAIQLQQVLLQFGLKKSIQPFTRCLVCNGLLNVVSKEQIASRLQPDTYRYFAEFWECAQCENIYWKGSHYERMRSFLNEIDLFIT